MTEFGMMGVDWEERINFDRLRRERLARAKQAVDSSAVDGILVLRYEDVRYVTGFRSHLGPTTGFGICAVFLPRQGDPILFTMDQDHARARMPWLRPEQIQGRPNVREAPGIKELVARLEAVLGRSLASATIGVDLWTVGMSKSFQEALPRATFVDGYDVLVKAKIIKTRDEIECLKIANMMTEAALDAALRFLRPGVRECEVLAVAWQTMTALGSEWTQCSNIVCSGPYTAPYRRFTSDRIIRMGDPVVIDIGACYNGYWGDFTRTWICGDIKPTKDQKRLHQQSYNALFAACAAARPGNTNADVYAAAEPVVLVSLGHGAGTNPWEPPFFSPQSKEAPIELRPNMVMNLEPWYGEPGVGGFRLENDLVVRDDGPEIYTTYPFDERLLDDIHPLDRTTGCTRR